MRMTVSYFRKVDEMKSRAYVTHAVLTSKFLGPDSIGGITDTIKKVPRNHEAKKDPNLKKTTEKSMLISIIAIILNSQEM